MCQCGLQAITPTPPHQPAGKLHPSWWSHVMTSMSFTYQGSSIQASQQHAGPTPGLISISPAAGPGCSPAAGTAQCPAPEQPPPGASAAAASSAASQHDWLLCPASRTGRRAPSARAPAHGWTHAWRELHWGITLGCSSVLPGKLGYWLISLWPVRTACAASTQSMLAYRAAMPVLYCHQTSFTSVTKHVIMSSTWLLYVHPVKHRLMRALLQQRMIQLTPLWACKAHPVRDTDPICCGKAPPPCDARRPGLLWRLPAWCEARPARLASLLPALAACPCPHQPPAAWQRPPAGSWTAGPTGP